MFSDHSGITLKTNNRRKTGKFTNVVITNTLLNSQRIKGGKNRKYFDMTENETQFVRVAVCN